MGRPKKPNNYLIDIIQKQKYQIREIHDERITFGRSRRIAHLIIEVIRPKTRKRIPLFQAVKHLKKRAIIRQTPFRIQFVIPYYYQANLLKRKFGIKNPIDEFIEIVDITPSTFSRREYSVALRFIDNIEFVKMMHELNKRKKPKKKRVKNTTKRRGVSRSKKRR